MQGWTLGGGIFQDVPGAEGNEYVFSIWGNPTDDWEFDHFNVSIFIQFRDGEDTWIQESALTEVDLTGPNDVWTQYTVEGTAPIGTVVVRVGMEFGGVSEVGDGAFRFDDAQINDGGVEIPFAQAHTNVYLSVRYAEEDAPNRVELMVNDEVRAWFPTENTGGAETFAWGPPLYLGDLADGTTTFAFVSSGLNMDRFRLVHRHRVNRPPVLEVPTPHTLVMGATTNLAVLAYDLDGDPVSVTNIAPPAGAELDNSTFTWQAVPGYGGGTTEVVFVASDPHGETNSSVTASALFMIPFDSDDDGLPDEWEWIHFQTLAYGPDDDVDEDRVTNYEHWIAGTQPTNPASFFHMSDAAMTAPGAPVCLTIMPTVPGRLYTIFYTDDNLAVEPAWQPFANDAQGVGTWLETNAVESVFTFCDDFTVDTTGGPAAPGPRVYRIRVEGP